MSGMVIEDEQAVFFRKGISQVLRHPACQWIEFTLGGATVNRTLLERAATAIGGKPTGKTQSRGSDFFRELEVAIRVQAGPRPPRALPRVSYNPETDTLTVANDSGMTVMVDWQGAVVDECVHAGLDVSGARVQRVDTECAGKIAGHLYRLFSSVLIETDTVEDVEDAIAKRRPADPCEKPFYEAAIAIFHHTRQVFQHNQHLGRRMQPGAFLKVIDEATRKSLHASLLAMPRYQTMAAQMNALNPGIGVNWFVVLQKM